MILDAPLDGDCQEDVVLGEQREPSIVPVATSNVRVVDRHCPLGDVGDVVGLASHLPSLRVRVP